MNKKIAIGIGIMIAIAVITFVITNELSYEKKEIGEKNGSATQIMNKSKTYEITASETVGVKSPP